jgi:ribosomal protein S18 acetylase RimI-like enzyme
MRVYIRKYKENIGIGSDLVIKNRLYTPGIMGIRKRVLDNSLSTILIAFVKGNPVGCLTIDQIPQRIGLRKYNIINTWIKPDYRGLNFGKKLLNKAEQISEYPLAGYVSKKSGDFYGKNNIKSISY